MTGVYYYLYIIIYALTNQQLKGFKKNVKLNKDHTKPPQRYTQGSLIGKMEELLLGTKSTRHEIIQKLYYFVLFIQLVIL